MKRVLLSILFTISICLTFAQGVSGRIISNNGNPVDGATIVLQNCDSVYVDVVMSDSCGLFAFEHKIQQFRLVVQHLAFKPLEKSFNEPNVGDIMLEPADVSLDELVVSAERPLVKVDDGKLSYDLVLLVKDKVANNVYEALTKLPGVSEKENALTLVGAPSLAVIINGKPTTMSAEQLAVILKSTPVERVDKVELMYSAPPQYHVRGAAINIVLKKENSYALQGEVGTDYKNSFYNDGGAHAFLRVSTPKRAFDVMYNLSRAADVQDIDMISWHTLGDTTYNIHQEQEIRSRAWQHMTRFAYEYNLNDRNSLSFAYNGRYRNDYNGTTKSHGNFQSSAGAIVNDKDNMHNFSFQAKLSGGLSMGADYTMYENDNTQNMNIDYADGEVAAIHQMSGQKVNSFHAYADMAHSLPAGWRVGYGATYRNSNSDDYQHYASGNTLGGEDVNSSLSEHTAEAYISVGRSLPSGLSFSLSATGEYYKVNNVTRFTIYPQGSLTFMRTPDHIFQATLNVDKQYPSYWQMQAAVTHIDGYSEMHNTPGLRPSKSYKLMGNYIYKQKYVLGAFWNYTDKMFAQAMYQSTERLALIYQNHNWDYMSQAGILAVVPCKPVPWLDTRLTLVGVYAAQRCDNFFDLGFEDKSCIGVFSLDNSVKVNNRLAFELNGFVQTPATQGTFSIETMWSVSAGAKWSFAGGKGTASCFMNDIFNSTIGDMRMNYKGQNLLHRNDFHTRAFTLSVIYRFGGYTKKEEKGVDTSRFGH